MMMGLIHTAFGERRGVSPTWGRQSARRADASTLALLTVLVAGVMLSICPIDIAAAEGVRRPNVLLLVADDFRPDAVRALGNAVIETPHLDGLVRRGTVLPRAFCPNPVCVPSRAEMLTGCSGFRNGVLPGYSTRLDPKLPLWPAVMRDAGYHTWHVGKWHIEGRPSGRGYEESQGLFGGTKEQVPRQVDHRGRDVTGYKNWMFQTDAGHLFPEQGAGLSADISRRFVDAAIDFIRRQPDKPFFLHVNFTAPHDPLLWPPAYEKKYDPARMSLPANFLPRHPFDHGNFDGRDEVLLPWPRTPADTRTEIAVYYAVVSHLDAQIGRILESLRATGQEDNTIIVFTSDHGLALGSHGLRGKQNMYEHTVGAPLILSGPGVPAGVRRSGQVYLRELFPTVCELTGVPAPAGLDGRSFVPLLQGKAAEMHPHVFGYFRDSQRMVRGERWKLIHYPQAARLQLFDLSNDPHEVNDLSRDARHETVRNELLGWLKAWQKEVKDPLLTTPVSPSKTSSGKY